MARFTGGGEAVAAPPGDPGESPPCGPRLALRRFRVPVPVRVTVQAGQPVRVASDRRGLDGGTVASAAGPWRTSGEWWFVGGEGPGRAEGWNRDEWDVALTGGDVYRIYRDRSRDRWFIDGIVD